MLPCVQARRPPSAVRRRAGQVVRSFTHIRVPVTPSRCVLASPRRGGPIFKTLTLLLAVVLIGVFVLAARKKRDAFDGAQGPWPFYAKRPLTTPEQVLYFRLVESLPQHIVLAQVQVSRVLGVKKGFKFNEWNNRVNRLSYDFVICSKDATVIAAVELDDSSHERADRKSTDAKKERATTAAGIRLVRWHVKQLPDAAAIRAAFAPPAGSADSPLAAPDQKAQEVRSTRSKSRAATPSA